MDLCKRQIFRDAFAQIFSLILRPCHIDIDKEISENIDIDEISNRLEFGISNRATLLSARVRHACLPKMDIWATCLRISRYGREARHARSWQKTTRGIFGSMDQLRNSWHSLTSLLMPVSTHILSNISITLLLRIFNVESTLYICVLQLLHAL